MYHDLLFALSGITGDVFQEKAQKNSYSLVQVAAGLEFLEVCEEALLNRDILPLASHILFLKRFIDQNPDHDKKSVESLKNSQHLKNPENSANVQRSFYLFVLQHAIEEIVDTYQEDLEKLEEILLDKPERANLTIVHNSLLPWYVPLERIATTLFRILNKNSFNPKIIDDFNTIADSSGNTQTQEWFRFLASKCTQVLENQTRELLFNYNLVDPYNEYFIVLKAQNNKNSKNQEHTLKDYEIDYEKIPTTILNNSTAQKIGFIVRTLHIIKNDPSTQYTHLSDFFSTEDRKSFSIKNADKILENMKTHANKNLVQFIGKDNISRYFDVMRRIFFLGDTVTWTGFMNNLENPHHATKLFGKLSDGKYEEFDIKFKVVDAESKKANLAADLDQSLIIADNIPEFTASNACDVYETVDSSNILSKLNVIVKPKYPFNLIFDEWSIERYNVFWRFFLRLRDISEKLKQLHRYSPKIMEINFVLSNLTSYLYTDVLASLINEYFSETKLYSEDFELIVRSHREFLLKAMQQCFLLSKMLFSQISELLNCIDRFCEKSQQKDDGEEYLRFVKILAVLFGLLTKSTRLNRVKSGSEDRLLKMLILRLDFNHYFSGKFLVKK